MCCSRRRREPKVGKMSRKSRIAMVLASLGLVSATASPVAFAGIPYSAAMAVPARVNRPSSAPLFGGGGAGSGGSSGSSGSGASSGSGLTVSHGGDSASGATSAVSRWQLCGWERRRRIWRQGCGRRWRSSRLLARGRLHVCSRRRKQHGDPDPCIPSIRPGCALPPTTRRRWGCPALICSCSCRGSHACAGGPGDLAVLPTTARALSDR